MTAAVSSSRAPGGSSTCSSVKLSSESGMKAVGTIVSPRIERAKNAAPPAMVHQRCRVDQRSARWYQAMTGPSVWVAIFSDLRV